MAARGKPSEMQPIPKGKADPKSDSKKEKAKKKAEAIKQKAPAPHQYVARLTGSITAILRENFGPEWKAQKEKQQENIIGLIQASAEKIITEAINDIAGQGFPTIAVTLKTIKFGPSVDFALQSTTVTKACHTASDKIGSTMLLVLGDPTLYLEGEMPKADKDQPELNLNQSEMDAYKEFEDDDQFDEDDDED